MRARAAALVALAALTACGGDEAPVAAGPPVSELRVGLQDFRLQLSAGALRAGPVTVTATNVGATGHDVVFRQDGRRIGGTTVLSPGRSETVTLDVRAGTVELECTVAGHAEAGMSSRMTVAA